MNRRNFLGQAARLSAATLLIPQILRATGKRDPVILLVSGWQDVNIGDIAHTPGLVGLLKERLPRATVILWKRSKSQKVEDMLTKYYPALKIINGEPAAADVQDAFKAADFFLHGSGPSVVAANFIDAWRSQTKKPFGIFGVTIQQIGPKLKQTLEQASFIFTRETASIGVLKKEGLSGNHIAFAPDATFDLEIHDDAKAQAFIDANQLETRKFICVVPRLRKTPYYQIRKNNAGWSEQQIKEVNALNDQHKETDHAKLREAMITWVRKTGHKIVVCPEMTYQVGIMDELLINPLPDDVKKQVVKHDYWLPDEAASLYAQAHTVLSFECHSPIIAIANGTPAFYLRQPEDTIKGQMYYDLGFADWTFEIEETSGKQISDQLMEVYADYDKAKRNIGASLAKVRKQYDEAFRIMRRKV